MARATSRKSFRTASDVRRAAEGANGGGGGIETGAARRRLIGPSVREDSELRFRDIQVQLVQLIVQRADVMPVERSEGREVGAEALGFGGALGKGRLPLGDEGTEVAEVGRRLPRPDERGHPTIIAEGGGA